MFDTLKVLNGTKLRKAVLATAGAAGLLLGTAMSAGAWEIGFDDFAPPGTYSGYDQGWIIDNEYGNVSVPGSSGSQGDTSHGGTGYIQGTTISAEFSAWKKVNGYYYSGNAVLFDTNDYNPTGMPDYSTQDRDLTSMFTCDTGSNNCGSQGATPFDPGHVLIIHEGTKCDGYYSDADRCKKPDDNAGGGKIYVEFSETVWLDSIDVFDINPGEEGGYIEVYADNMLQDTFWLPTTGYDVETGAPSNSWAQVDFGGIGADYIKIKLKGSGAIDNIVGHVADNGTGIPEPASLGLMAAGIATFGAVRRRRRRKA